MRKRISSTLWGLLFIAVGLGIAGDMAGIWEIRWLFEGWWTLFLIIPAFFSIIESGIRISNTLFLLLGVALLACSRGYLPWEALYQLLVPAVMIIIGFVMVVKSLFHLGDRKVQVPNDKRSEQLVVFSGKNVIVQDEFFGMDGDAIFGGLTIDLRHAVIKENISMDVMAVFGGVDILMPPNVTVKLNDTSLFGGCSNARKYNPVEGPIVYVNAIALFGGVEVK